MSKNILQRKRILTKAGGSSISTPISVSNGGTGITSYAVGDILYASGATTLSKLAIGTALQQLRVNAGATALEYFTPASGGITVGTTTITGGATTQIGFNDGGVYSEDADFTWNKTTNKVNTTAGYNINGGDCIKLGVSRSISLVTSNIAALGQEHTVVGAEACLTNGLGRGQTHIGYAAMRGGGSGVQNISLGAAANFNGHNFSYTLFIGSSSTSAANMDNTASNQAVIGMPLGNGYTQFYFGQGVSAVTGTPSGVTFNATPGTTAGGAFTILGGAGVGTDKNGGAMVIGGGAGSGAGVSGSSIISTGTTLGTGATAHTLVPRLTFSAGAVTTDASTATWADALDFVFSGTIGTKIGTATTQKIAFWNATPIVQPSGATQAAPAAYSTGAFGLDSDANMQALYDLVVAMRTALVDAGIMKGSA